MRLLQFSGGIDSLATLFTLRDTWDTLTLLWVDTGNAYADTRELVEKVAKLPIKQLVIINSDQPMWVTKFGYPVDVLPVWDTGLGRSLRKGIGPLYQSPFSCCGGNIWKPMYEATKQLGATVVYRGQRESDRDKAVFKSGHAEDGITYVFPIEDWSREEVFEFTRSECPELVPAYYAAGELTGHDCMDCTAYLIDNVQRIKNLPPGVQRVVFRRLDELTRSLERDTIHLLELQHGRDVAETV